MGYQNLDVFIRDNQENGYVGGIPVYVSKTNNISRPVIFGKVLKDHEGHEVLDEKVLWLDVRLFDRNTEMGKAFEKVIKRAWKEAPAAVKFLEEQKAKKEAEKAEREAEKARDNQIAIQIAEQTITSYRNAYKGKEMPKSVESKVNGALSTLKRLAPEIHAKYC